MALVLPFLIQTLGFKWVLTTSTLLWIAMFLVYARMKPRNLVIASMAFHGLAYAFFINTGIIYINHVAAPEIRGSAQALYITATLGIGLFLGTQFTGWVMDRFRKDGRFSWRPIFLVPCVLLVACTLAFIFFFKGSP